MVLDLVLCYSLIYNVMEMSQNCFNATLHSVVWTVARMQVMLVSFVNVRWNFSVLSYSFSLLSLLSIPLFLFLSLGPCSNGDIRLGDDNEGLRGRVEVCINMSWYTICHHGWSQREASVVCHQLGYSRYGENIKNLSSLLLLMCTGAVWGSNLFLNYEWPMSIFNVNCTGSESSIWDCSYNNSDESRTCQQSSDVSVFCMSKNNTCH